MISVLMPVHNGAAYIAEAARSLGEQTFADWDAFWAFATQPESQAMNDDMASFLDAGKLQVTVTSDPVVVV